MKEAGNEGFMIALQKHGFTGSGAFHKDIKNLSGVWSAIDVVTQKDY